ncbi:unnamed protein product [Paramecium sonneborni]|uniref:Uncharacterized protein n=1 Tax=Paramecium sonneborni TaxID=65129 RepID=A0A8S1PFM2_9CILI|nr:unnamed protein product [Paramecium sonneborni]CAD8101721.1 unnamed protein product [Paramecium sonneborni]
MQFILLQDQFYFILFQKEQKCYPFSPFQLNNCFGLRQLLILKKEIQDLCKQYNHY